MTMTPLSPPFVATATLPRRTAPAEEDGTPRTWTTQKVPAPQAWRTWGWRSAPAPQKCRRTASTAERQAAPAAAAAGLPEEKQGEAPRPAEAETGRADAPPGGPLERRATRVAEGTEPPPRASCCRGRTSSLSRATVPAGSLRRTRATCAPGAATSSAARRFLRPSATCPSARAPAPPSSRPALRQPAPPRHPIPTPHRRRSSPYIRTNRREEEIKRGNGTGRRKFRDRIEPTKSCFSTYTP